jgi:hypothetical protein
MFFPTFCAALQSIREPGSCAKQKGDYQTRELETKNQLFYDSYIHCKEIDIEIKS